MKTQLLTMAAAVTLAGCATPLASYSPATGDATQTVAYQKGTPITVSTREHSQVAVSPPEGAQANQRPVFLLAIVNTTDAPVTIGIENVSARTSDGRTLAVISPEQLEREAHNRANWVRFAAALSAAGNSMRAANAGYSYQSGTYNGNATAYGTGGSAYGTYNGTYSGTTYDSAAAARAQAQANIANQQLAENANAQAGAILQNADAGALQRQTIPPGGQFMTPVTVANMPTHAAGVVLTVTVNGDVHEFAWNYSAQ